MIRKIRDLLYEQGFTIIGARNKLQNFLQTESAKQLDEITPEKWNLQTQEQDDHNSFLPDHCGSSDAFTDSQPKAPKALVSSVDHPLLDLVRHELIGLRDLLSLPI
ncbi:MAG: transcriptional regulator, MerR family [Polaromonas sp.]|nr:transcriptional regulator, MerR family [Polaromonas sp.]